jgi:hypothetical protein
LGAVEAEEFFGGGWGFDDAVGDEGESLVGARARWDPG